MAVPILPALGLFLVIFALVLALTIYQHVTANALSLPIAPTLTSLVLALPIVAIANALFLVVGRKRVPNSRLIGGTPGSANPGRPSLLGSQSWPALSSIFQLIQGIVTVATGTLLINTIATNPSSSPLRCALETTWQHLYSQKDAAAVQRIQDALQCCGFNSVVDRAWPFPGGGGGGSVRTCAETYARTQACRVPWTEMVRRRAGVELAVVLAVALFQGGIWMRWGARTSGVNVHHDNGVNHDNGNYYDDDGVSYHNNTSTRRPLLEDGRNLDEDHEDNADQNESRYVDDNTRPSKRAGAGSSQRNSQGDRGGYGSSSSNNNSSNQSSNSAPRLEPSGLADIPNEWSDV